MSGVLVDFSPAEAAAILERLRTADGSQWIDSDPDLISGARRLEQALAVERGPGGNAQPDTTLAELAEQLVGQDVLVCCKDGSSAAGRLHPDASKVLHLETASNRFRGIPLSRVYSISVAA